MAALPCQRPGPGVQEPQHERHHWPIGDIGIDPVPLGTEPSDCRGLGRTASAAGGAAMRVLREDGPFKVGWDILICLIALATGLLLPLDLLHGSTFGHGLMPWWMAFSAIGLLDILFTFHTSYEQDGVIVRDPQAIARRYLRGGFAIDLAANVPFFLAGWFTQHATPIALLPLLRLQQLVRITHRWEALQLLGTPLLRIIRYGMVIVLVANLAACLWLWVGLNDPGPDGWLQRYGMERDNIAALYLRSLYWTVTTLATVGYGDITPKTTVEIIVAILVMLTGISLYAFAIGNVVNIINTLDDGRSEHHQRQSAINAYLHRNGVDQQTMQRVRRFNDYQWSRSRGFRPEEMFRDLPDDLRSDVMYGILRDTVQHVPLFRSAPPSLQKRLLLMLRPASYPPGVVVLDADEVGREILFITRGVVRIETSEPLPDAILNVERGDYIGDLSFFLNEHRTCRAIATTYVDAFCLTRSVFEALRQQEPRLLEVLHDMARQQTERNQALLLAGIVV